MKPTADNSLRQAAAFVQGLTPDAAQAMLGRLSADEARVLRAAISELAAGESAPVAPQASQSDDGTVELQLGATAAATVPSSPVAATPEAETFEPPFDGAEWLRSLDDADPKAIAEYLSQEHPRAIAVVLSYLSARLAAGVLQSLGSEEQSKVVAQLADQGDADPESLRVIASGLADWVQSRREASERRSNRVATIRQILAATPASKRQHLLAGLAKTEPEVAAALAEPKPTTAHVKKPVTRAKSQRPAESPTIHFDQLHRVDSHALTKAIASLEGRTALLALAGASEDLLAKLTSGLPRHAAKDLHSRLHRVGPTTLAEIDRSQNELSLAVSRVVAARNANRASSTVEA